MDRFVDGSGRVERMLSAWRLLPDTRRRRPRRSIADHGRRAARRQETVSDSVSVALCLVAGGTSFLVSTTLTVKL
jgi:hypothetical protein